MSKSFTMTSSFIETMFLILQGILLIGQITTSFLVSSNNLLEPPMALRKLIWAGFVQFDPSFEHRPEISDLVFLGLVSVNLGLSILVIFFGKKNKEGLDKNNRLDEKDFSNQTLMSFDSQDLHFLPVSGRKVNNFAFINIRFLNIFGGKFLKYKILNVSYIILISDKIF